MDYTLQTPIKVRKNGEDALIETLAIPTVITVSMMREAQRNAPMSQFLAFAIDAAAHWAGLDLFAASKLESPDAIAYVNAVTDAGLLSDGTSALPNGEMYTSTLAPPVIRPVRAVTSKITADFNRPIELACQVLEAVGMDKKALNALDVRELLPRVPDIVGALINPKI